MRVEYRRCPNCGFVFTNDFDSWSVKDFKEKVYNQAYGLADPDYVTGKRAREHARLMRSLMIERGIPALLDYGGGDGELARVIRTYGLEAVSWDCMTGGPIPKGIYKLITAFEVMEHTIIPLETLQDALSYADQECIFYFSTLCIPRNPDHWYIAPRNGHVSIHSFDSLEFLFKRVGWKVQHLNESHHVATKNG
jgi:hypothetical protein